MSSLTPSPNIYFLVKLKLEKNGVWSLSSIDNKGEMKVRMRLSEMPISQA